MDATDTRFPVTLLTGFLGAGKTTLLNAILIDASGLRIAVIVNEFGEAGLDHDLIEAVDEDIVLMQSGCLCCSIRGDLSRTLQDLAARRQEDRLTFDRVVIETTGLADPAPILQTFLLDTYLAKNFHIDGVVTVVDAATGPDTLIMLRGPDILRVKGIVHLAGIEMPFVFHGVQHLFDPPVPLNDWQGKDRQSRIVVIARDMASAELVYSLDTLRARQTAETA